MIRNLIAAGLISVGIAPFAAAQPAQTIELSLLNEDVAALARSARTQGDPARGAAVFSMPSLTCTKCHAADDSQPKSGANWLGPDLAQLGKDVTDEYLIDSVLRPSKAIKKGFETATIATADGKSVTGLLADESADRVVLRDPAQDGKPIVIPKREIDARNVNGPSIMPAGLVNGLTSRQQFLDLIRYLRAIADGGAERAKALRPDPSQVPGLRLPYYEAKIDHAGMIAALGPENLERGAAIYNRVCINCHGTKEKLGSLPTSLRFSSGRFKNGNDIYSLYRTLTGGFGQMPPQTWMVPSQKYDVIYYLRETFLKHDNPSQYVAVDRDYLARLPRGTTRGPEPSTIEPWSAMDYGPTLTATYEVGDGGVNFAYKGIAIRLDAGPGGISRGHDWTVFDHDTMRLAAAWKGDGFIDWNGINFNGRHEEHPKLAGRVEFFNPDSPGWANLETGAFDDARLRGRDGHPYGPLPRSWAHYAGQFRYGDQVILAYTVGKTRVLESHSVETQGEGALFSRTFNLGARDKPMVLQVARVPGASLCTFATGGSGRGLAAYLGPASQAASHRVLEPQPFEFDGSKPARPRRDVAVDETGRAGLGKVVRKRSGGPKPASILAAVPPPVGGLAWLGTDEGDLRLMIPAGLDPLRFTLKVVRVSTASEAKGLASSIKPGAAADLTPLTRGGPARWPEILKTAITRGADKGPFAVDTLELPENNPWLCQLRLTGLDFLDGGKSAAICTWDGDVWIASGIDAPSGEISWKRIASGLFQPLGLKVHDGRIFVSCRDQIVVLHDKNGDGETDFYENFNSDHQVTEHFHEFAMGLQTDAAGNFYYAKAARHGKTALVPQHGTLLRVSADGRRTDILATGFRAPNGVCLNDDGTFFLTDQEGFWTPKNRINHVKVGGFYGNMWGYHNVTDSSDAAMEPPVCWITNAFDRSPAELVRVTSDAWGPLNGALLNLSYGNGKIFVVPYETVDGVMQGGMCALPIEPLPTGVMRGRFNPSDRQLYACGMYAWAGDRTVPGGLFRIRSTGKPMFVPGELHATERGLRMTFTGPIDRASAVNASNYSLKRWSLKRTANYGSDHFDETPLRVTAAALSEDGRTVILSIPEIQPTWGMEIVYRLKTKSGDAFEGTLHNTIHRLAQ